MAVIVPTWGFSAFGNQHIWDSMDRGEEGEEGPAGSSEGDCGMVALGTVERQAP
jgi:hypothetical protein